MHNAICGIVLILRKNSVSGTFHSIYEFITSVSVFDKELCEIRGEALA